jgi:hypothetical protein
MQRTRNYGHKSSLVVSKLDSPSKGCWFESRVIQSTRWKWLISKPCQDWLLHPILVHSLKNKKNRGSQTEQNQQKKLCPTFKPHTLCHRWVRLAKINLRKSCSKDFGEIDTRTCLAHEHEKKKWEETPSLSLSLWKSVWKSLSISLVRSTYTHEHTHSTTHTPFSLIHC